jgi:hypothetical protein
LVVLGFTFHRFTRSASSFDARKAVAGGIHVYQRSLSPLAARIGIRCRFTPTCSRYAEVVIQRDGVLRGGWLAVKRVARCGPWTTPGTTDEP